MFPGGKCLKIDPRLLGGRAAVRAGKWKGERRVENWLKSVSAFANGTGGVLVFGTAEDGTVAGVKDMETASEIIRSKILQCIVPSPQIVLKTGRSHGGKEILLLEVASGKEMPYYYIDRGKWQAYVREGKENVPAGVMELKRMILQAEDISFDSIVTDLDAGDFTFSELGVACQEWSGDVIGEEGLESLGLVKNGRLTNAGLLFADDSPAAFSRLHCVRWQGTDRGGREHILDCAEYRGNLFTLLNKGIWFIKRNMKVLWSEEGGKKTELPDYCDGSIFEGMVNALAHRDYLVEKGRIRIDMYDDRLTVTSPGGMADGSRIREKVPGSALPLNRNPVLANVFSRIGYMEQEGAGLSKIRQAYERAETYTEEKMPEFDSDAGQFTLTLKNLNAGSPPKRREEEDIEPVQDKEAAPGEERDPGKEKSPGKEKDSRTETGQESGQQALSENEKKVLSILREQPAISTDQVSRESMIAKRTVERTIQSLKKKGIVAREGSRRRGVWRVRE